MEENDSYVYVRLTPREARVVEMFLAARPKREIAKHFAITTARLNQIIQKAKRKVEWAQEKRRERIEDAIVSERWREEKERAKWEAVNGEETNNAS